LLPLFEALRLARDEVGPHREVGAREIECVFVFHCHLRKQTVTAGKMSVNEGTGMLLP